MLCIYQALTHVARLQQTYSLYDFSVCDLMNCNLPEVPRCEDGQTVVLKNPGECQPIHECGRQFTHSVCPVSALLQRTHRHKTEHISVWPLLHFSSSVSVCKKEECALQVPPACPTYRRLSVKKTKCCDVFECVCSCQNSTKICPAGFITSSSTNDCGCTETHCLPDKVTVFGCNFQFLSFLFLRRYCLNCPFLLLCMNNPG